MDSLLDQLEIYIVKLEIPKNSGPDLQEMRLAGKCSSAGRLVDQPSISGPVIMKVRRVCEPHLRPNATEASAMEL